MRVQDRAELVDERVRLLRHGRCPGDARAALVQRHRASGAAAAAMPSQQIPHGGLFGRRVGSVERHLDGAAHHLRLRQLRTRRVRRIAGDQLRRVDSGAAAFGLPSLVSRRKYGPAEYGLVVVTVQFLIWACQLTHEAG